MSAYLAILATAGLAALPLVVRSGSMSTAARGAAELPLPRPPGPNVKPRWRRSWIEGGDWARGVASKYLTQWESGAGMYSLADEDRRGLMENTLNQATLEQVRSNLRRSLIPYVRPHAILRIRDLAEEANEKLREKLTVDEKAFWTGVAAYVADVHDWMTSGDPLELGALTDDIEVFLVKAWLKNKKKE